MKKISILIVMLTFAITNAYSWLYDDHSFMVNRTIYPFAMNYSISDLQIKGDETEVTETSYWPVEFTIDNNYHIHIKPDPIYIGAALYACTNKQFLYHKYAIT
jgi:hypothetical protein